MDWIHVYSILRGNGVSDELSRRIIREMIYESRFSEYRKREEIAYSQVVNTINEETEKFDRWAAKAIEPEEVMSGRPVDQDGCPI